MKLRGINILTISLMILPMSLIGQSLTWTGSQNSDFYNEQNWKITGSEDNPTAGSLDPDTPISYDLYALDATLDITGQELSFSTSVQGFTLMNSSLTCDGIQTGIIHVSDRSTLIMNSATPIGDETIIDIVDMQSWVKMLNVDPDVAESVYFDKFMSKSAPLSLDESARINQYYFMGSLIRLIDVDYHPLTLFDRTGQAGDEFGVSNFTIYSRQELGDFDNRTSSFKLERGYQVNMAVFQNGTSKSQVYIAIEEDLEVDLPFALDNNVSFVRVIPWNWVTKKGVSNFKKEFGATWSYNWNNGSESLPSIEYAPMSWGGGGASDAAVVKYREMEKVTHVMGFNESDNCNDQSGQYGGLCQIEIAVPLFKNLMRTGLRLVSPSPRENGPFTWLKDFRDEAKDKDVRYDVLGVHWYDWGANPVNTPFEDPAKVFTRFKNYLDRVYAEHQMPIWITEFNANANRDSSVHIGFLKLALPYLESLDFVERYDFFSVNPEVAGNRTDIVFGEMFNADGSLSLVGQVFKNHQSTPSISAATWSTPSFLADLNSKIGIQLELSKDTLNEGDVMVLKATTNRAVGSPQTFRFQLENLANDQYTLRDVELTIPEGGTTAETNLFLIDDDDVEDTVSVIVTIVPITDGIELTGQEGEFVMVSEDQVIIAPLSTTLEKTLKIYPNPTSGVFSINNQPEDIQLVELISMDGRRFELLPDPNGQYHVEGLSSGLYIISMQTLGNQVLTERIIVK
jgi:hypothetical protein